MAESMPPSNTDVGPQEILTRRGGSRSTSSPIDRPFSLVMRPFTAPGLITRENGNPLSWLARRRIASGRGFERYQTDMILVSE
jgi:hypothetical protein